MHRKRTVLALGAAALMVAAGCGSSKSNSSGGGGSKTITIGILTDATGAASSGNKTSIQGVAAGAVLAKEDGYTIKTVVGDTQTSPAAVTAAAEKLVTQDHVSAVIAVSAVTFLAAKYLTSHNVPVIGAAEDSNEWITSQNMFAIYGYLDPTKVSSTFGAFMKMEGVTTVGALGYSISPSSADAATGDTLSAKAAGLSVGYLNANFPFGSTNVQPVAIAMKSKGVDGMTATVDPNTGFAIVTALRNLGATPKVALLPTGYGGDLQQAGPGALQSGQGVYFGSSFEPVEMHTAATQQFVNALSQVGITSDPTYAEYCGYASVALLLDALKADGGNTSASALISALGNVKGYNAAGLFGSHSFDLSDRAGTGTGVDSCSYITKLSGSTFQLVPNADPICGTVLPDTVKSS